MNKKQVKKLLKKHNRTWQEFNDFMHGQTVGMDENGDIDFYLFDVERFFGCEIDEKSSR